MMKPLKCGEDSFEISPEDDSVNYEQDYHSRNMSSSGYTRIERKMKENTLNHFLNAATNLVTKSRGLSRSNFSLFTPTGKFVNGYF